MFYQLEHIGTADYFKKETGENFSYPPHLHQNFELILVEDGEMTVTVDRTSYLLTKGKALLVFPAQIHALHSVQSKHILFIFAPRIVQTFSTDKKDKLPCENIFSLSDTALETLRALSEHSTKFELKGALYSICALFDKQAEYRNSTDDRQDALFKILSFVEQNFKSECSLLSFAKTMGYNPDYISRIFKKKIGLSYNRYVNARRLNYAVYLLTNTDRSCLYCALESGYISLRSFNRNFKEHFGCSPKEYQLQHKNHKSKR